jgi:hypothetical protein
MAEMNDTMKRLMLGMHVLSLMVFSTSLACAADAQAQFKNPPLSVRPQVLCRLDAPIQEKMLARSFKQWRKSDGFGGYVLQVDGAIPLASVFYGNVLKELSRNKEIVGIYQNLPAANALRQYRALPSAPLLQRLVVTEESVQGPKVVYRPIPSGKIMAVVGLDTLTYRRYDLTGQVYANRLKWHVPAGNYTIVYYSLQTVPDSLPDWYDAEAVKGYLKVGFQPFFERFHSYYGKTIRRNVVDLTLPNAGDELLWTPVFNQAFRSKYGSSPALLYPALTRSVGTETEAVRAQLLTVRDDLYTERFLKATNDWVLGKGLRFVGMVSPSASVSWEAQRALRGVDVPGMRLGETVPVPELKAMVSAVRSLEPKKVAAMVTWSPEQTDWNRRYAQTMRAYAEGVNDFTVEVDYKQLEAASAAPEALKAYTQYVSRLNLLLHAPAKTVADVAVLYPNSASGTLTYGRLTGVLRQGIGTDFACLSPDVFREKCVVKDQWMVLKRNSDSLEFRLVVVPEVETLTREHVQLLTAFYQAGGKIVFAGAIDSSDVTLLQPFFPQVASSGIVSSTSMEAVNAAKGQCFWLKDWANADMQRIVQRCLETPDVLFSDGTPLPYLHRLGDGHHLWFFANDTAAETSTALAVKGKQTLVWMDPHTGKTLPVAGRTEDRSGQLYTVVDLRLPAYRSVFLVSK